MNERIKELLKLELNQVFFFKNKEYHFYNDILLENFKLGVQIATSIITNNNGWISVDDDLPTQSDQYWVAYRPISNCNTNEKTTEICYCTAHFDSYDKIWSVKDQLFYTQRRCKVLFWQPLPQPPKGK